MFGSASRSLTLVFCVEFHVSRFERKDPDYVLNRSRFRVKFKTSDRVHS